MINLVGKSPRNHKQDCKSSGDARKKPHLQICTSVIRKKNIEVSAIADGAGPEKPQPKCYAKSPTVQYVFRPCTLKTGGLNRPSCVNKQRAVCNQPPVTRARLLRCFRKVKFVKVKMVYTSHASELCLHFMEDDSLVNAAYCRCLWQAYNVVESAWVETCIQSCLLSQSTAIQVQYK